MTTITVELRTIEGTQASVGIAGGHTLIVDRPQGRAGGLGLGFNGGQLLGLALGGCLCNDLRSVTAETGVVLGRLHVAVRVDLGGEPPVATAMAVTVDLETPEGCNASDLVARAWTRSTVGQTLLKACPVDLRAG
jgi:organic hydroperoxide reductase OsmC/OhrA